MKSLHKLLARQLKKHGIQNHSDERYHALLTEVNEAYWQSDADRMLLERSLDISSDELTGLNRATRSQLEELKILHQLLVISGETRNLQEACTKILEVLKRYSGFPFVTLEHVNATTRLATIRGRIGIPDVLAADQDPQKSIARPLFQGIQNFLHLTGDMLEGYSCRWNKLGIKTYVGIRVPCELEPFQVLSLGSTDLVAPSDALRTGLIAFASQLGTIIDRFSSNEIMEHQRAGLVATAKMSALGEMASGIAHEINTPLAAITTLASQLQEVIKDPKIDQDLIRSHSERIEKTAFRIAKIVKGLRSLGRNSDNDDLIPVQVRELIEDVLILCRERLSLRGIRIEVQIDDPDLSIQARQSQLAQVLVNLLNNAYDAICDAPSPWIKIECLRSEGNALITVTDSGHGISSEIVERIFNPFFTTKDVGKGTGLGLSISKNIMIAHGGDLTLDGTCKNTRFIIRLPLSSKAGDK